jgi:tetratricopeptide (TPR) repeat protein
MNSQNDIIELIDLYLGNKLDPDERRKFEQDLVDRPEMAEELKGHKLMIDGIRLHGRKILLNKIRAWDEEMGSSGESDISPTKTVAFRWYYAAAAVVILILSIFTLIDPLGDGYEGIVAQHYQPYVYISELKRGEPKTVDPSQLIFDYYDRGEYQETIKLINGIAEADRSDLMQFLLANSYQALDEFKDAIPVYEKIINSNSAYIQGAKWYLALCYLSEQKPDEARTLLDELTVSKSSYAPKSAKLLEELD